LLKSNSQRITLTHISLALVGLMWVLPFLHYYHKYPITTFYQEWWSALFGVLALCGLFARDYWRQLEIPRIVQLPLGLMVVVLLQMALGMMAYAEQGLLYLLYLLFATLLMLLGARLRDEFGIEKLALALACFLLVGAELNALLGVLQHYHWHSMFDGMVVAKVSTEIYGNLAQRNHFANYIALGLVSLGLLFQQRKLRTVYVLLLAMPLLWVMMLSGSRSSWLYLFMMNVLAWWAAWRKPEMRRLAFYSAMTLVGFVAVHFLVKFSFFAGSGNISTLQRFSGADAFGGIRLYVWHEAWLMFSHAPWLGAGFGQFAYQHFQLGQELQRTHIVGLFNNSHDLVFQLAAEAGLAGLGILFASLAVWVYGLRRVAISTARWWAYALLGVLAIHSLLEYPLWYVYFLAIAAILLGALDETRYRFAISSMLIRTSGSMMLGVMLLFGFFSLIQVREGYRKLERTLAPDKSTPSATAPDRRSQLAAVHEIPLLLPYAELFQSSMMVVSGQNLEQKLALNSRVLRFAPIASVAYRQALLLAQNGQLEQAKIIWEQAVWSYPNAVKQSQLLQGLAEKDPENFAALLEFALIKEQEYARAVHHK